MVDDREVLNFLLFDPQQVFPDGTIRPTALLQIDAGGLSVLRDQAENTEFSLTVSEMKSRSDDRQLYGVARFLAADIRYQGNERVAGVYDTPLPGKPCHADIFAPVIGRAVDVGPPLSSSKRKVLQKRRLEQLNRRIGNVITKTAFREGFLAEF